LSQLEEIKDQIDALGYQLLMISPDHPDKIKETIDLHHFSHLFLSDSKVVAAIAFGIAFQVDSETLEMFAEYGIDLNAASGETHHILPVPAVFVLQSDGTIYFEYINPAFTERLNLDVLLAAAKAGQQPL
jgi:peroxiredoxin